MIIKNRQKGSPFVRELGNRFELAFNVTSALANILAVRWFTAPFGAVALLFDQQYPPNIPGRFGLCPGRGRPQRVFQHAGASRLRILPATKARAFGVFGE
jgi:hypothetical protein